MSNYRPHPSIIGSGGSGGGDGGSYDDTALKARIGRNEALDQTQTTDIAANRKRVDDLVAAGGVKGDKGERGDVGPVGPIGPQGERGLQGLQGERGPEGLQGPQGERGLQGIQGVAGTNGVDGVDGQDGVKGDPGAGIKVIGNGASEADLPPTASEGDGYFIGDDIYVYVDGAWHNRGPFRGPAGPQGPAGPRGETGDQGVQGIQGVKGDTGAAGVAGPEGPQGPKGDQGVQGIQGLKGDTGAKGLDGSQGPKGDQGPQGVQGLKGDTGAKGDTGSQGIQGIQGPQGVQGPKGDQGPQGPQGPAGSGGSGGRQYYGSYRVPLAGVSAMTIASIIAANAALAGATDFWVEAGGGAASGVAYYGASASQAFGGAPGPQRRLGAPSSPLKIQSGMTIDAAPGAGGPRASVPSGTTATAQNGGSPTSFVLKVDGSIVRTLTVPGAPTHASVNPVFASSAPIASTLGPVYQLLGWGADLPLAGGSNAGLAPKCTAPSATDKATGGGGVSLNSNINLSNPEYRGGSGGAVYLSGADWQPVGVESIPGGRGAQKTELQGEDGVNPYAAVPGTYGPGGGASRSTSTSDVQARAGDGAVPGGGGGGCWSQSAPNGAPVSGAGGAGFVDLHFYGPAK